MDAKNLARRVTEAELNCCGAAVNIFGAASIGDYFLIPGINNAANINRRLQIVISKVDKKIALQPHSRTYREHDKDKLLTATYIRFTFFLSCQLWSKLNGSNWVKASTTKLTCHEASRVIIVVISSSKERYFRGCCWPIVSTKLARLAGMARKRS